MKVRRRHAAAVLATAAVALYLPALDNGFAYDDVAVIQLDSRVHSLANAPAFFIHGYWADAELALYRPLTTLSFAVDWFVSGGNPAWFLFMNALWNAVACVLAFLLLHRFAGIGAAFGAGLLFAAHPVHVEAVANVVGRAELGAAVFTLGGLLLWPPMSGRARYRVAGVATLFALALLMKESAIMLPAVLVLLDAATGDLRPGTVREWLRCRVPPLLILGMIALIYLAVRVLVLGGVAPDRLDAALEVTAGTDRQFTVLQAWPVYLRLLFMPIVLVADYGPRILMPTHGLTIGAAAGAVIIAVLVLGGVYAWTRSAGTTALALLWFPVTILPVSNLIVPIGIIVAERTLYLPSLALALGVVVLARRLTGRTRARTVAGAAIAVVIALFATRTVGRIPDWHSTDTIFAALLRDRPDSFRAHWHQARIAAANGQHDTAIETYAHAIELWPHRRRLVIETIRAADRAGHSGYALELARYAARRWSTDVDAARLHAAATLDFGDTVAARRIVADALEMFPGDSLLLRMQRALSDGKDP